jgi:alpha-glucoside transport system substrate-binding protein
MTARTTLNCAAGTPQRRRQRSGHALCAVLVTPAILAIAASCGGGSVAKGNNNIEVLAPWAGSEKDAFLSVTQAFTQNTGIQVQYTKAHDFMPALRARLVSGDRPDVAILPRPDLLVDLAHQGAVKDLGEMGLYEFYMDARYSPAWIDVGTLNGNLYGVAVTANSKSVIWYRPDVFAKAELTPPRTWDDLLRATRMLKAQGTIPWAQGAKDSSTLTDWFENVYVRTAGPQNYQRLFEGDLSFSDPSVKTALTIMVQLLNDEYLVGGVTGALQTGFVDGIGQIFGRDPKAVLYMDGGIAGGIAKEQLNTSSRDADPIASFPWPTIEAKYGSPVVGRVDLAVAFTDDLDVREFLLYLSSAKAGRILVSTGAIVSPNKQVPEVSYPNNLLRSEARHVTNAEAFRSDGSDALPGKLADDWGATLQSVLKDPGNIDSLLTTFQSKAQRAF